MKIEQHIDINSTSSSVIELLSHSTGLTKSLIKQAMTKGAVWLTRQKRTQRIRRADKVLKTGDKLHIYYDESILGQCPNDAILVADEGLYSIWNKPYGMFSQGSKWGDHCTINRWVERNLKPQRPAFIVHRLDRAANGLIIIAHQKKIAAYFSKLFQNRQIEKYYHAIVNGHFQKTKTFDSAIENRPATSHVKPLKYDVKNNQSHIEISIETGRKHQIRRHLSKAGFPIVGDRLYGKRKEGSEKDLCLTSCYLSFMPPSGGTKKSYTLKMNKPHNMLSTVTPWEMVAEGYAETTMKVFRGYAEKAIKLAKISPQCNILDIACGPGTLSMLAKNQAHSIQAVDFSKAMTDILNRSIGADETKNISVTCCDGQDLPFQNEIYDAAFSMFGLMFFPDRPRGYAEMYRTLKPGGKIVISSWAPIAQSPAMQIMFGAMKAMKPELPEPQSDLESLENPEFFKQELVDAGFKEVGIQLITETIPVESVDEFWQGIVKGSAPIVMMKNTMSAIEWQKKERVALAFLHKNIGTLPTELSSDAWLAYGIK